MFSSTVGEFIKKMGMNEIEYYDLISSQFGKNVTVFETMISFFMNNKNFKKTEFNDYVNNNKIDKDADFVESLFELFCCVECFICDGKLKLYKFRQPEWSVPRVVLNKSDFEFELLEGIEDIEFIYRGLSKDEFDSGVFGQSWTTLLSVARDFASRDYNQPNGLVVKTSFKAENVLHIAELPEYEVIVENGSIKKISVEKVI